EPEVDDIAILHDIVLSFKLVQSLLLRSGFRPAGDEVIEVHDLRTDEPSLDVGMDLSCSILGTGADLDRPGPDFLWSCSEEAHQPKKPVALMDQLVEASLM